jgi:tetraacyldisaccharide 4'-kinase
VKPINILYWPLSKLYETVTNLRNWLYDTQKLSIYRSKVKTIGVGNLTVGGTGKTPMVEYLAELLGKDDHKIAILSRGYGRQTSGYIVARDTSTAQEIGDEPLQFFRKFGKNIKVVVCEKRAVGLQNIESQFDDYQLVILDDVFQHRAVDTDILILLTDYGRLFTRDFVLPSGLLREAKTGAKRADVVVVTKCPADISAEEMNELKKEISVYTNPNTPILFATIQYQNPVPYFEHQSGFDVTQKTTLISGIAQPMSVENAAKKQFLIDKHHIFKDHYDFKLVDIEQLSANQQILTTEKDWVKLQPLMNPSVYSNFYYWPMKIQFLTTGFDNWIRSKM